MDHDKPSKCPECGTDLLFTPVRWDCPVHGRFVCMITGTNSERQEIVPYEAFERRAAVRKNVLAQLRE